MPFAALPILAEIIPDPTPWMMLPFAAMLLCIALLPIFLKHHWERHYHRISIGLGLISVGYYVFALHAPGRLLDVAHDYLSFIALIGSLYVVAGGIHIRVSGGESKPWMNCVFLIIGAVLANIIGTTGASMLLIRPWIRMNKYRFTSLHTAFFIFIISNVAGSLTPIGDPPLFLGYLQGVPFWWMMENCWKQWLFALSALLAIFYFLDRLNFLKAPRKIREMETAQDEVWKIEGLHNLFFLALILGAVFVSEPAGLREVLMFAAAAGSYFTTKKTVHAANDFSFGPIKEVSWLFLGIFATMVPALDYLQHHAGSIGIREPVHFFWCTGLLSGLLDNAPTYLAFLATAFGLHDLTLGNPAHMAQFQTQHGSSLAAISLGSVFFGAMTYIGNGPNLMVKAIAEQAKVPTPNFFTYVFRFSLPFLVPVFVLVTLLFFRK